MSVAVEALLERLSRDAEAAAAALVAAAEAEASARVARSAAASEEARQEALARLEQEQRRALRQETAAAERAQREAYLLAREQVIDRIFLEAEGLLRTLPLEQYQELVVELLARTLRFLEGSPTLLYCRPELVPLLQPAVAGTSGVRLCPRPDAEPGLLGVSQDGRVTVDNTLVAVLRRARPQLVLALAGRLAEA